MSVSNIDLNSSTIEYVPTEFLKEKLQPKHQDYHSGEDLPNIIEYAYSQNNPNSHAPHKEQDEVKHNDTKVIENTRGSTESNHRYEDKDKPRVDLHYNQVKIPKAREHTAKQRNYDDDEVSTLPHNEAAEDSEEDDISKTSVEDSDILFEEAEDHEVDVPVTKALNDIVPTNIASHVVTASYFSGYGIAGGHAEDISVGLGLIGMYEQNEVSGVSSSLDQNRQHTVCLLGLLILVSIFLSRSHIGF